MESQQPVPVVDYEDVERIVRRDFGEDSFDVVMEILGEYGGTQGHEPYRIWLAALKKSCGDIVLLRLEIEEAKKDYRDLLARAETPNYLALGARVETLPKDERDEAIVRDWDQYQNWLHSKTLLSVGGHSSSASDTGLEEVSPSVRPDVFFLCGFCHLLIGLLLGGFSLLAGAKITVSNSALVVGVVLIFFVGGVLGMVGAEIYRKQLTERKRGGWK